MGRHGTRIALPVVGLLAVTAALAIVATAPLVLFPATKGTGPAALPAAAAREVTSVTAPLLHPERKETRAAAAVAAAALPAPIVEAVPGPASLAGTVGEAAAGATGPLRPQEGRSPSARLFEPTLRAEAGKGKGKAKAKGHVKDHPHGKATGHVRHATAPRIAFTRERGTKPRYVAPPRAHGHPGKGARAHARPRR